MSMVGFKGLFAFFPAVGLALSTLKSVCSFSSSCDGQELVPCLYKGVPRFLTSFV